MKHFLILIFCLLIINSYSQARIGFSYRDIYNEFSMYDTKTEEPQNENQKLMLTVNMSLLTVIYYFNSEKISFKTVIYPKTLEVQNALVDLYNRKYEVISPTHWKMYNDKEYVDIELYLIEKSSFFVWE